MIHFFRKIRQNLLSENRVSRYLLYAIGEIVLVVIGILIALQINNYNEAKKQRRQEVHYLQNLKTDLQLNISELDNYIAVRNGRIESANKVLEYFEGKPLIYLNDFAFHTTNIYIWQKFTQQDNTFQELINSGNLALISNDSIKDDLLNLQSLYSKLKNEEAHFRYDAEVLLYEPSYAVLDLNPIVKNFTYQVTNGQAGEDVELPRENYEAMLRDLKQKNGFMMAVYEFSVMNSQFEAMKELCYSIIDLIDRELKTETE
ncbi:hypothetical protein SAMN06265375_101458 [Muriicola jejuensis]|uniref:Uncharacterized protein n=1 Tax=Muriicola jejuensis TaxID=504488 RepID=A0A6P0U9Z6_9FLAO|nr:DUF6090 family protein [Muriicola jejuensis]NER10014.1 hypothetical protein [Muriicola jejuensis]SMP03756.1 hypothetical protein SAMN06265375_101458 [Muriicola jejuensis]